MAESQIFCSSWKKDNVVGSVKKRVVFLRCCFYNSWNLKDVELKTMFASTVGTENESIFSCQNENKTKK